MALVAVLVWVGSWEAHADWRAARVWQAAKVWRAAKAVPGQRLAETLARLDQLIDGAQAAGKPLPPAAVSKSIHRQAGFTTPVRVGPAPLNVGLDADGTLTYSELAPRARGAVAPKVAAGLPLSAAVAKILVPGTEVLIEGRGQVAFHADSSPDRQLAAPLDLAKVNTSAVARAGLSTECRLSVLVKRLAGDKVLVSLAEADAGRAEASLSGHVDAKVSVAELAARAKIGPVDPGVTDKAQGLVDGVTRWTQADAAGKFERARSRKELKRWVLDLSKTEGATAFDELIHLDTRRADALGSRGPGSGVAFTRMSQRATDQGFSVQADVGKQISLLNWARNRSESSVVLRSSEGDISFSRVRFGESYSDLFTDLFRGKRSQSTQLVQMQRAGRPAEAYLHVRQTAQGDRITSEADLHRLLAFAELIGAGSAKTAELRKNAAVYQEHFDNNFGRSSRTIDLYVTDAGLAKLAQASPEKIRSAFAQAYETMDRPTQADIYLGDLDDVWGRTPWLVTEDPSHKTIMKLLETPSSSRGRQVDIQYRRLTGRSLALDSAAWQKSQGLVAFSARLRDAKSPAERAREFAKISSSLDLGKMLATIAMVAGKENLLINELSLRGERGFDLTVVREPGRGR
jgi:hypothetical protein